jgi:hypothetical protein
LIALLKCVLRCHLLDMHGNVPIGAKEIKMPPISGVDKPVPKEDKVMWREKARCCPSHQ